MTGGDKEGLDVVWALYSKFGGEGSVEGKERRFRGSIVSCAMASQISGFAKGILGYRQKFRQPRCARTLDTVTIVPRFSRSILGRKAFIV